MNTGALIFMLVTWTVVLSLLGWSFYRLMKTDPSKEAAPPPGTSL